MDNKNLLIIISIVIIAIITLLIFIPKNKNGDNIGNVESQIDFDEETRLYYIKDNNTNEIIYATQDENDPELQFYLEHPDYNPTPLVPRSTDLKSWGSSEANTID